MLNNYQNSEEAELRLWNYIDGTANPQETAFIHELITTDAGWKAKYEELITLNGLLEQMPLEQPSLRFAKNVMESIAVLSSLSSASQYINSRIIRGIAAFFGLTIAGCLIYGIRQAKWQTMTDKGLIDINIKSFDFSALFNNNFINGFIIVNVMLALVLLERFLSSKQAHRRE